MISVFSWIIFLSSIIGAFSSIFLASSVTDLYIDYTMGATLTSNKESYHSSGFFKLKSAIEEYGQSPISETKYSTLSPIRNGYWTQVGITSHHLPTAMSFIADFYKTLKNSDGPRETFVILGPDHLERCDGYISITQDGFVTPFGRININKKIKSSLVLNGVTLDDNCFEGEHAIGVHTAFIKYFFPESEIVPILFSSHAADSGIENLTNLLLAFRDKITLITSVDFSHYENYEDAKAIDTLSEKMIKSMDVKGLTLKHVDSPASVKTAVLFAKGIQSAKPLIIGRTNSYDFTSVSSNTTGYINSIFPDYKKTKDLATLMFVGDMMLTRDVGREIEEMGDWRWPFLKIGEYLSAADLTFGNLETTISERGYNVGSIYSFRSNPKVVEGLKFAGFDILSVANNHMGDWTRTAFEDTFNILKASGIDYVGGGFDEEEAHSPLIKELKGTKFGFLGYTDLGAKYTKAEGDVSGIAWANKEIVEKDVKNAKEKSDFLVVSFHFGDEYKTLSNARQKILARAAIDAGASLVIGHHPHVIQETEEYNGGFIAYSLGNFVFDQKFSKETMEGLILKVIVKGAEILEAEPIKFDISEDFQPFL